MARKVTREATAYHEAGHAVAAFFLEQPFTSVTIIPGDDYWGKIMTEPFRDVRPDFDMDLNALNTIERAIRVANVTRRQRCECGVFPITNALRCRSPQRFSTSEYRDGRRAAR